MLLSVGLQRATTTGAANTPPPLPLIFPPRGFLGAKGYFANVLVGARRKSCPPVLFGWQSLEKNRTTTTTTRKKPPPVVPHESASGARQTTDEFYVSLVVNVPTGIHPIWVFTSDMPLTMSLIEICPWECTCIGKLKQFALDKYTFTSRRHSVPL